MEFLPIELQLYVEQHSNAESPLLRRIHRETHLNVLKPRMLSGHLQGRVLSMFAHMIRPQRVLEIGTYTGYSALCMAEGLASEGRIITIDINEELESMVREYFRSAGNLGERIDYIIGNAVHVIPTLTDSWDLVFIDADKENYALYYDLAFDQVRSGGFIIADNVLWSGKVFDPTKKDKDTKAIRAFNQKIHQDERIENVLFPIRDGLMIVRKK
ncbi:MAG: O-methyltransferase [Cyclobacteriaceae bacterium]|nr:O-methyltransferase [Cyclobacteriaceae bacterium HetDA_MAG_MS6]